MTGAQRFRSAYNRVGIVVPAKVPTIAVRHRLGSVHVGTSEAEVIELVRCAIDDQRKGSQADQWTPEVIEATVRFARWQHAENRAEYRYVMGGMS